MSDDDHPRFMQIALVTSTFSGKELIYALDEAGFVWQYEENDETWYPLGSKRDTSE